MLMPAALAGGDGNGPLHPDSEWRREMIIVLAMLMVEVRLDVHGLLVIFKIDLPPSGCGLRAR